MQPEEIPMFLANLVFADINGHSDMPMERRARVLQEFWRTCEEHKPQATDAYAMSFYDIDNDSLMAGFSGMRGLESPPDVLIWTLGLLQALAARDVPVSFGVGLAAGRNDIDWDALPGFLPQLRTHLYFPDDQELLDGRVDRRRLMGDPLILAARLLSLAKKAGAGVAFALLPGDQVRRQRIEDIQAKLRDAGLAPAFSLSREVRSLPIAHQEWTERWHVEPYGLARNSEEGSSPGA
jgi:hypothetical protein